MKLHACKGLCARALLSGVTATTTQPSASEIGGFLQGLIGSVVQGVGEIAGASGNSVTTAGGETLSATPQVQGTETVIILETATDPNQKMLVYGALAIGAFLVLRPKKR